MIILKKCLIDLPETVDPVVVGTGVVDCGQVVVTLGSMHRLAHSPQYSVMTLHPQQSSPS